ncbi:hypothetical protein HK096_000332, partial [Nowakowskiella sp. JEL0078]
MDQRSRRLLRELHTIQSETSASSALSILRLTPVSDDNLSLWSAVIVGPKGSPYEGGKFNVSIVVPDSYPQHPPNMKFTTKICHPNVHFTT